MMGKFHVSLAVLVSLLFHLFMKPIGPVAITNMPVYTGFDMDDVGECVDWIVLYLFLVCGSSRLALLV